MSLKRTSQPAIEPVTLPEALAHLRAEAGAEDAYITSLISAAREACENLTERTLISSNWTLVLDAFPDAIKLTMPPIIAAVTVKFIDVDGVQQTLNPADYIVDTANSQVGYIVPNVGKGWPATQSRINAVEVTYTAGYGTAASDVPGPMKQWMLLAVGDMYANREASAERPTVSHDFSARLLDAYRIWGF